MNVQTIITIVVMSISTVVSVVFLTIGFVKKIKYRRRREKRLGYKTMPDKQALNTLKSKVREQVRLGYIPSVFEDLYNDLTIDSKLSLVKKYNKCCKEFKRKRGYYKKNVNEDLRLKTYIKVKLGV